MNQVLGFLLLCFTVLGGTSEDDPLERVLATLGLSAVLPCRQTLSRDAEVPTIEWSKVGLKPPIVFVYRQGVEVYAEKHQDFQFRTHLFMTELHHGNFSMRLSEVRETDSGKYLCKTLWSEQHDVITVELVVEGSEDSCTFPILYAGFGLGLSVLGLVGVGFLFHKICSKSDKTKKIERQSSDETTTSTGSETKHLLTPRDSLVIVIEETKQAHQTTEPPDLLCSTPTSTVSNSESRKGSLFECFPDVGDNNTNLVMCDINTVSKSAKFLNKIEDKRSTFTRQDALNNKEGNLTISLSQHAKTKITTRSKSLSDPCSVTFQDLKNQSRRYSLSVQRLETEKLLQDVQEEPETDRPSSKVGEQG